MTGRHVLRDELAELPQLDQRGGIVEAVPLGERAKTCEALVLGSARAGDTDLAYFAFLK
jgi:hypothetical protein